MKEIKELVEQTEIDSSEIQDFKNKISKMSLVEQDSYFYNLSEGNLNEEDGINCPICKNKGKISFVENGYEKVKNCECMNKRRMYYRFIETGISKDQFKRYTLSNYDTTIEWQRYALDKAKSYLADLTKNEKAYWFYIGGNSGTGKTHLCTGIIAKLLNSNFSVKYMVWNTEIPSLISQRKSFYQEDQDLYRHRVKELKECQVLYIDDFLQLDTETKESLSVAYEIINSRYTDDSKITIISSEVTQKELYEFSKALCGRIIEKSKRGDYVISVNEEISTNYRMKKGE